jgi:hypothetical protein
LIFTNAQKILLKQGGAQLDSHIILVKWGGTHFDTFLILLNFIKVHFAKIISIDFDNFIFKFLDFAYID